MERTEDRTPGRPKDAAVPRVVPLAVSAIARLAPDAAAAWAARRFLRPQRLPLKTAQRDVLDRARKGWVRHRREHLAVYEWDGRGATVLLAHGWNGRAGQLTPFVEPLLARGFRVVAFDAPAHGCSRGTLTHVPAMGDALAAVAHAAGGVHGIIAHSVGCLAAARAVRAGVGVRRLVMVAPVRSPMPWAEQTAGALGLPPDVRTRYHRHVEAIVGTTMASVDLALETPRLRVPVLVLRDPADPMAALGDLDGALATLPHARGQRVPGLGHFRILREPAVVEAATEHMRTEVRSRAA